MRLGSEVFEEVRHAPAEDEEHDAYEHIYYQNLVSLSAKGKNLNTVLGCLGGEITCSVLPLKSEFAYRSQDRIRTLCRS
jgi:hypothetical protein